MVNERIFWKYIENACAGLALFLETLGRLAPRANMLAARSTLLLGWAMQHALCKAGEISIRNLQSFENR